jgi:pimeloyl-ACP methyl ester carboxylesterase
MSENERDERLAMYLRVGRYFFPGAIAGHIARAIPNARLVTIRNCGHFAYLECSGDIRRAFNDFFRRTWATVRPH